MEEISKAGGNNEGAHNIEAEQIVLGTLLVNNAVLPAVPALEAEWFYDPVHAHIMNIISTKISDGELASPVTLKFVFKDDEGLKELGGVKYLAKLAGVSQNSAFAQLVAEIRDLWARRTLADSLSSSLEKLNSFDMGESPQDTLSQIEAEIARIMDVATRKPLTRTWLGTVTASLAQIDEAYRGDGIVGTSTGLKSLDKLIGGMAPADMIVLAGRPSMGKTAMALQIAWLAAQRGDGVFFASLEMAAEQLVPRFASSILASRGVEVPYFSIRTGRMSETDYRSVAGVLEEFSELPIVVADKNCRTMPRLRTAARRSIQMFEAKGQKLGLIVVDYLQLIEDPDAKSEYARVSKASSATKALAVALNVPVLVLSQLNRSVESRDPPIPRLSDLRESGRVEEDADIVMLMFRASYYQAKQLENEDLSSKEKLEVQAALAENKGKCTIMVQKARGGPTGKVRIAYDPEFNYIRDL